MYKTSCWLFVLSVLFAPLWADAVPQRTISIQHWQTTNGVPVYFIPTHDLPMVHVALIVDAGSIKDGQQFGIANLTASLLNQGTNQLTADEIARKFENLGAIYSAETNRDFTILSLQSLTRENLLKPALEIFHTVTTQVSFPDNVVDRQKQLVIQSLKGEQQDPESVANNAFFQALYNQSPYAHAVEGTILNIESIQRNDVLHFYQQYYNLSHFSIAIVGTIDNSKAKEIAEKITEKWPKGENTPSLNANLNNYTYAASTRFIAFPANQSFIRLGEPGIRYNDPDYFALMVGNEILGGGMISRLMQTVREKAGFTYNIASYLVPFKFGGAYIFILQTRLEKTSEALTLTKNIISEFIKNGPSESEVKLAKAYYAGNFPLKLDSHDAMLNFLVSVAFYHRPLNYLQTYLQNIDSLTPDKIHQAFIKHFQVNNFLQVVVGSKPLAIQKNPKENN